MDTTVASMIIKQRKPRPHFLEMESDMVYIAAIDRPDAIILAFFSAEGEDTDFSKVEGVVPIE